MDNLANSAPQPTKPHLGFVIRTAFLLIVGLLLMLPCLLGFIFMIALTRPACGPDTDPAEHGTEREDVRFPSSELAADYLGYFLPGENGATIIVVPTHFSGRGDRIDDIIAYHRSGYGVLTYRSRSCLGLPHSLGYAEVTAVGDALTYLRTRVDIDITRVAIHGFSAGGAASLMAFARYPELRAAIAQGGYHDFSASLVEDAQPFGLMRGLFDFSARLTYRLAVGQDISVLSPISAVRESAPRPILLIYGSTEVSLGGAREMQAVDPARITLWEVPGAGHGDYISMASEEDYSRRVRDFLTAAFHD
jgi:fermentation-respiration switch protein FrsA (DUF1100 family)